MNICRRSFRGDQELHRVTPVRRYDPQVDSKFVQKAAIKNNDPLSVDRTSANKSISDTEQASNHFPAIGSKTAVINDNHRRSIGIRRALTRRFPYAVYFSVDDDLIVIIAVLDTARDPAEWQFRI